MQPELQYSKAEKTQPLRGGSVTLALESHLHKLVKDRLGAGNCETHTS